MALTSDVTKGTPRVNVAVTYVAESTVTESALIPANYAIPEKSVEKSKPDPVNTILFPEIIVEVTAG
jgi:hypothetical protein